MSQQQKKFAIVGMGCRFPGHANSLPEFWENLANKKDCIVQVPDDRWNAEYFNSTGTALLLLLL
jgi:acyl transferase domain-containing protein